MGEGKRLDQKRMDQFKDWARCHEAVHPGELLKHIAALEDELSRLTPSGQVAEDDAMIRTALKILEKRTGQSYQNAADALERLAAKAQGYEALAAACREALGPHHSAGTPADVALLHKDLEAARAFSVQFGKERDAAVADNAALVEDMKRAHVAAMHVTTLPGTLQEVWEATSKAWRQPHPGAALLEQHRKALEDAYQRGRDDERKAGGLSLARARNEGLEKAASRIEKEADVVEQKYAERRNVGGSEEPVIHAVAAVIRGAAAIARAMKEPEP